MSTDIRPEVSKKNRWYIPRERYYELQHFCKQYPMWKKEVAYYTGYVTMSRTDSSLIFNGYSNPTEDAVIRIEKFQSHIKLVDSTIKEVAGGLAPYLMKSVAYGKTYAYLQTVDSVPCCRETFYDIYREFFWALDKKR